MQLAGEAIGTQTNEYGFYTLPTPGGRHTLRVTYVGYSPVEQEFVLRSDSLLELALTPESRTPPGYRDC